MGTLSERFASERGRHDQSFEDVARIAGVKKQTIMKIEHGTTRRPGAAMIEDICRAWGVNTAWLLHGTPPKERSSVPDRGRQTTVQQGDDYIATDLRVLRAATESIVKALTETILPAGPVFVTHLLAVAEELGLSPKYRLLGDLVTIAQSAPQRTAPAAQTALRPPTPSSSKR